jgi:hypothetical protein
MDAVADDILELARSVDGAELRGEPMALAVRLSQAWISRPGGWQLAAIQFSTLGSG